MSYTVTIDVFCDGRDPDDPQYSCAEWVHGNTTGSKRDAWISARDGCGWVRRNGKHLCPRCASK